jgi:hypothetical protein
VVLEFAGMELNLAEEDYGGDCGGLSRWLPWCCYLVIDLNVCRRFGWPHGGLELLIAALQVWVQQL